DLVQSWMYHADLAAGLAGRLGAGVPVVWGIRNGSFDWARTPIMTRLTVRACAATSSRLPARIIVCSEAARTYHRALGYDDSRMVVVPNGVDAQAFRPDPAARATFRAELGLPEDALLIGSAARFHPMKDHATLIQAFGQAHRA